MKPPSYTWVCHKCNAANPPGRSTCESCGFQAMATGKQIQAEKATQEKYIHRVPLFSGSDILLFFPEIIPAAFIAVCSPIWIIELLIERHFLSALVLSFGVGLSGIAFYSGVRSKGKFLAYLGVSGMLLTAFLVYK